MRICCAGEVMVEMSAMDDGGLYRRGVAGDSFNTAVYLARAGCAVSYLTRLGDDAYSDEILDRLTQEGIGTDWVTRCAGRQPGLYVIDNDADGERQFSYWRDHAPARELFDASARALQLEGFDVFYFTGITLAVTCADHHNLVTLLARLQGEGCRIVFDPNYRPRLWDSVGQAREASRAILANCDMVMTTLGDDRALWGEGSVEDVQAFYREQGVREIVLRDDALKAFVMAEDEQHQLQAEKVSAVDTTGAGDAFNAAYLAHRLAGDDPASALAQAQALAARVVQHHGAILPD